MKDNEKARQAYLAAQQEDRNSQTPASLAKAEATRDAYLDTVDADETKSFLKGVRDSRNHV